MRIRPWGLFLLLCVAIGLLPAWAAGAAPKAAPPQLSIAVDDGHPSAKKGDKLTYTVTVTNLGAAKVNKLLVSQTLPTGATFVSADSKGAVSSGKVTWKANIDATKKATFHTTVSVSSTPPDVLRLATVACANISVKGPPVVCASDSNLLPAGAAAQAKKDAPERAVGWLSATHLWWYVSGGAVLLAALTTLVIRSRRRAASSQPHPQAG